MNQSEWNGYILIVLCILVIVQIAATYAIFSRIKRALIRVEALLTATETHSRLNQENKEQLTITLQKMKVETTLAARKAESEAKEASDTIQTKVDEVPKKVVEEIKQHDIVDTPITRLPPKG